MDAIFSSDFSVDEFLLLEEIGFQPVEMVVGTSVFHIGNLGSGVGRRRWARKDL